MNKKSVFGAAGMLLLLVSLCACSGSKVPNGSKVNSDSKFPYGIYTMEGSTLELGLMKSGSFLLSTPTTGQITDQGTFSVKGNELTWERSILCYSNPKSTYTWTYENEILILRIKQPDPCNQRQSSLDGVKWHLKK